MYRRAGNVFKGARESSGKKMIDLAKKMNLERAYLCRVENGAVALGRKNFKKFADAYELTKKQRIKYVIFLFNIV